MTTRFALWLMPLLLALVSPAIAGEIPLTEVEIQLQRTSCLGECPAYSVTVRGDGHVTFEGQQFTTHVGPAEWSVEQAAVLKLIKKFLDTSFFDVNVDPRPWSVRAGANGGLVVVSSTGTDGPRADVTFKLGDRKRTIHVQEDTQLDIRDLPDIVDDYARTAAYVRGKE